MVNSDEDFSIQESDSDNVSTESVPSGIVTRSAQKRRRQCTQNVSYNSRKKQTKLPNNLQQLSQMKSRISKWLQGKDIDTSLSLRIIKAALDKQETHLCFNQCKNIKSKKPPPVRDEICNTFSISATTYARIIGGYLHDSHNRTIYSSGVTGEGRSGNQTKKITRILRTDGLKIRVREFVRFK